MTDEREFFTRQCSRALLRSQATAAQFRQVYIAPEHLLLALLQQDDDISAIAAHKFGMTFLPTMGKVLRTTGLGKNYQGQRPELSDAVKQVIEDSVDEAAHVGNCRVTTAHLLLGLLHLKRGLAFTLLQEHAVNLERTRTLTLEVIQQQATPEALDALRPDPEPHGQMTEDENTSGEDC